MITKLVIAIYQITIFFAQFKSSSHDSAFNHNQFKISTVCLTYFQGMSDIIPFGQNPLRLPGQNPLHGWT
jgi:hypothetical protein